MPKKTIYVIFSEVVANKIIGLCPDNAMLNPGDDVNIKIINCPIHVTINECLLDFCNNISPFSSLGLGSLTLSKNISGDTTDEWSVGKIRKTHPKNQKHLGTKSVGFSYIYNLILKYTYTNVEDEKDEKTAQLDQTISYDPTITVGG